MGLTITVMARLIALTHPVPRALLDKAMAVVVEQRPPDHVLRVVALHLIQSGKERMYRSFRTDYDWATHLSCSSS